MVHDPSAVPAALDNQIYCCIEKLRPAAKTTTEILFFSMLILTRSSPGCAGSISREIMQNLAGSWQLTL
jgi:hypothetical protein